MIQSQKHGFAIKPNTKVEIRELGESAIGVNTPPLEPNVVHVWVRSLQGSQADLKACYELLSAEEQQRATRFRVETSRNEFVLTRGTLRSLLSAYLGSNPRELSFGYSPHGKPFIEEKFDVSFSVSHTDSRALIAFARNQEIGVDVEKIRPQPDAGLIAERFFSVCERRALDNLSGDHLQAAFFRCWTRKEAYVKAMGEGLSLPLHQFDVSVADSEQHALLATRPDPEEAARWLLCSLPAGTGYAAALAVRANTVC